MALIAASFTLAVALVFGWVHTTLFNSREFSARATELLDSAAVRSALAERIADQIIRTGPSSLVSYRSVIVIVIEGVTQTDAFKEVFKRAVRSAHDAVFTADGDSVVLNLVDSMQVIRGTLEVVSPDAARQIPTDVGDLIVDLTNEVRGLELWQVGEDLDELVGMLFIGAFAGFAVAIAIAIDRRRAVIALGCGLVVSCALVLLTVALARHFVIGAVPDPELRPALGATFDIVTADLRSSVIWLAGYGVLIAAVANTSSSRERRLSVATASLLDCSWSPTRDSCSRHSPSSAGRCSPTSEPPSCSPLSGGRPRSRKSRASPTRCSSSPGEAGRASGGHHSWRQRARSWCSFRWALR